MSKASKDKLQNYLLQIASQNISNDSVDLGFFGSCKSGGNVIYNGLFRKHADEFHLFTGLQEKPITTVNQAGVGYTLANLNVNLLTSNSLKAKNTTNQLVLGTTNTTILNAPAPGAPITLTLPSSASDTLVARTTTDTLTNKTLTGISNLIDANSLRNGSTWVVAAAGSAPLTSQIIKYNGTNLVWDSNFSYLTLTGTTYTVGTASQSTNTITGSGTTFTSNMVGGLVVFANGIQAFITAFVSATSLTVAISQTVTSQNYTIYYLGLQLEQTGNIGVQSAYITNLIYGLTNKTTLIAGSPSSSIVLTLPALVSDTLVGLASVQTMTNKTLTGTTNSVDANSLRNGSTWVVAAAGSAPLTSQIIKYNGTNLIWDSNFSYLTLTGTTYTVGTASQSTNTITGSGTTFTSNMVGGLIVFANGIQAFITAFVSATSLTVATSQTVTSQNYTIYYSGLQLEQTGNIGVQSAYITNLIYGSTNKTTVIAGSPSLNVVLTLPDITDTLVGKITTDILSNKTLSSPSTGVQSVIIKKITSQTASLTEWHDENATILTKIDTSGNIGIGNPTTISAKMHALQGTLGNEVVRFESNATNDFPSMRIFQDRVTTTNNTATTIHTFTIASNTTYNFDIRIVARRTGGSAGTTDDSACIWIQDAWKNISGTATRIGTQNRTINRDQASWTAQLVASSGNVNLQVTGNTNNNIVWHAHIILSQVST